MDDLNPHLPYLLHALSPIHVGGDEGRAGIDLPTQREQHTGYPLVPGSSVKGVLREEAEDRKLDVTGAFGPPQEEAGDHRGGLVFTDALLLALPVRSLFGTFAWLSCPFAVHRLDRDLRLAGLPALPRFEVSGLDACLVPAGDGGGFKSKLVESRNDSNRVFLEELELDAQGDAGVAELSKSLSGWLWPKDSGAAEFLRGRLAIVHDDLFGFLTRLALEVRSRVKINRQTGTAEGSGPWTEEHIPAEALLAGLAIGRRTKIGRSGKGKDWDAEESLRILRSLGKNGPVLRFGGNATIGLGRARLRLVEKGETTS